MDVSADLHEISRTPVVVVSAGIKSILDIRRTLEVLETMGVPTVSYGTDEFPAFFSPHSGVASPARMDNATIIAKAYWAARELGLPHGMLIAVPNDDPAGENVERAIQQALADAENQNIHGQALTPFVLKEVARQTSGDSLRSNMALVRNNARIGAEIAIAIALQKSRDGAVVSSSINPKATKVVVLGGAVVDILARPEQGQDLITATSNPGICTESDGGVGRNIAEALGRLGSRPLMHSAVGNDSRGRALKSQLEHDWGVMDGVAVVEDANTATYLALLDGSGDLHTAVADMAVLSQIRPPPVNVIREAKLLVMDANPPLQVLQEAALAAAEHGVKVVLDPTSVPKARGVAHDKKLLSCISYAFPNVDELLAMVNVLSDDCNIQSSSLLVDKLKTIRTSAPILLSRMHPDEAHLIVTMGQEGVFLASNFEANKFSFRHFPSQEGVQVVNATGAGDSLCGAFCHGILEGKTVAESVAFGIEAAVMSLQCRETAISPNISNLIKKV
jgi:sugar/nucleoside kinase (ribokinase family)